MTQLLASRHQLKPAFDPGTQGIIKCCWAREYRRSSEGDVFAALEGQFGVPKDVSSFLATSGQGNPVRSYPNELEGAAAWRVFASDKANLDVAPEPRGHVIRSVGTLGQPASVVSVSGPLELIEATGHAVLGSWKMWRAGWMHRDVSAGNVMLMATPRTVKPVTDFENDYVKGLTTCKAKLIDGDQAALWADESRTRADGRSATLPFVSVRLLDSDLSLDPTPIDDLESHIWVALWNTLHILNGCLYKDEQNMLSNFNIDSTETLLTAKGYFADSFSRRLEKNPAMPSTGFRAIGPVLFTWLRQVRDVQEEIAMSNAGRLPAGEDFDTIVKNAFADFFQSWATEMTRRDTDSKRLPSEWILQ